ncbi:MAG TPA: DegT/DnrJ/EryC1/StrS family aminotransferase [Verrucomicrobiae bacterium]|nr:DegT/DnrJ/EryC1/StrS family aminotransferase [Verrucomicrobiae bacterium]
MNAHVHFLDLKAHHEPMRSEILAAINEVIDTSAFAGGPFVAKFEEEFAGFCETLHAVGVGSGTEALWFALLAYGIGPGDEVITVPNSFMATAEAISFCGAKPVFVDVNPETYTLDPKLFEKAITEKTRAVIPVHLFGQMADMDPILEIAKHHKLRVIEDACQAHGATYKNKRAGSIGDAGCFSFYPGKNLGAMGEAGAVVTHDATLAQRIRVLRDHGQDKKYHHSCIGWNGRMDGIQAAVLSVKLKYLGRANAARRLHAYCYNYYLNMENHFKGHDGIVTPVEAPYGVHAYHLFVVRVKNRDHILKQLSARGIGCGIHYPIPIHLQKAYQPLNLRAGSFPVAEQCAAEFLSLPMFPELTLEQIQTVERELRSEVMLAECDHERAA